MHVISCVSQKFYFFAALPNLIKLDISNNNLKYFERNTFWPLKHLKELVLSGNSITQLPDEFFSGLDLYDLDLSRNLINPLSPCTFCNRTTIKRLDLSQNKFTSFSSDLLLPLALSLEHLKLDNNLNLIDAPSSLIALLQPLRRVKSLSAAQCNLNENLPESTFDHSRSIVSLNLSGNVFRELSGRLLSPLAQLSSLDVSNNKLEFLDPSALQTITNMQYLNAIYFDHNPFSCYRCHILPFIDWLESDPEPYWKVCSKLTDDPVGLAKCAQCSAPSSLTGRYLHDPSLKLDLEWCTNPEVQLRLQASEPQIGLILGFLIILSLVAIIVVIVAIYRKQTAVYYTQEEKVHDKSFTSSTMPDHLIHSSAGWTVTGQQYDHRMNLSNGSTTLANMSRQTTLFSPQSSLEQNGPSCDHPQSAGQQSTGVCDICVSSTAVKQVIASLPAMTEMLENSLRTASSTKSCNGSNGTGTQSKDVNQHHVTVCPSPPPPSSVSNLNDSASIKRSPPKLHRHGKVMLEDPIPQNGTAARATIIECQDSAILGEQQVEVASIQDDVDLEQVQIYIW